MFRRATFNPRLGCLSTLQTSSGEMPYSGMLPDIHAGAHSAFPMNEERERERQVTTAKEKTGKNVIVSAKENGKKEKGTTEKYNRRFLPAATVFLEAIVRLHEPLS